MIPLHEAESTITFIPVSPEKECIPLADSLSRILAEDVFSPFNIPRFDKSAMDGYAINSLDRSSKFVIIEVIPAGVVPAKKIGNGQCAKIMTGAMVPDGADRVVRKEVVEEKEGSIRITGEDPEQNICFMGEDVRQGEKVLSSGALIRAQEVAVLASTGKADIHVYKTPLVGIIATGSELIEPGQALKQGQVYNSNSYSLAAQVKKTGAGILNHGVAVDTEEEITTAIKSLLNNCRMILLSGGVSAGDYDLVPGILKKLNVTVHFEKVAVKPGKPTLFGSKEGTFFFGIPGNPVSTFVIFEILIKPLIYRMMGHTYVPLIMKGTLLNSIKRKHADRSAFIPVLNDHGRVEVIDYHGSAHIMALTRANGLVKVEQGIHEIPLGSTVDVRSI